MDLGLQERTALIPGGSKGVGLACSKALAAEGVNMVISARDPVPLEHIKAEIQTKWTSEILTRQGDLHDPTDREEVFRLARSVFGTVDTLIRNTPGGVSGLAPAADTPISDWHHAVDAEVGDTVVRDTPLQRLLAPQEIATLVTFLCPNTCTALVGQPCRLVEDIRGLCRESKEHQFERRIS